MVRSKYFPHENAHMLETGERDAEACLELGRAVEHTIIDAKSARCTCTLSQLGPAPGNRSEGKSR